MAVVILFLFAVNGMLLWATGKICGSGEKRMRIIFSAFSGALLMYLSMLRTFHAVHPLLWRLFALQITAWLAFGFCRRTVVKSILFTLLHLSLGEMTGGDALMRVLLGAAGLGLGCWILSKESGYIPVELSYAGQTFRLTALHDSGNLLRDPISGRPVLVVGADIAAKLTGLTPEELTDPVNTMGKIPGLQLIPYQTVGNTGFMLALTIHNTRIGNRQGSTLVAFSPIAFKGRYQALTGGRQ